MAVMSLYHSYNTVSGIVFDGGQRVHIGVRIAPDSGSIQGSIFEDNIVRNIGATGFSVRASRDVIIRHNLVDGTGYYSSDPRAGSSFYIGSPSTAYNVNNIQVYGNTMRDMTFNMIDFKDDTVKNARIHHNIFEDHKLVRAGPSEGWGGDGLIRSDGSGTTGNIIENNIFRNAPHASYTIRLHSASDVLKNVFYHIGGNTFIDSRTDNSKIYKEI